MKFYKRELQEKVVDFEKQLSDIEQDKMETISALSETLQRRESEYEMQVMSALIII